MTAKENINRIKSNPKIRLFLVLLFLSALYWFFTSLSEVYTYKTFYTIKYNNLPENLYFQQTPPDLIPTQIKATGFEIISQKIFPNSVSFDVGLFKSLGNYKYYYKPNKQDYFANNQTNETIIESFISDSIFVYLGKLKTKKVPIISKVTLAFKAGYKLSSNLQILPDSIVVKGPEKFVDSIKSIKTKTQTLENIDTDINYEVDLKLPKKGLNITNLNISKIVLKASVAKFTEGTMELPIILPKAQDGKILELFPKTAVIKYEVTFENYQDISSKSFTISCSYPKDSTKTLDLVLIKKPNFIKNYTIDPKEVTYLIQQIKK
ncbi:MAG TPA: YbbR-like domain-containing protein [Lutibacter sp.]|nr:YbbR-like domain-containing protein [Lutibacter sp.]